MNPSPDQYVPGTCNIGKDELDKRKRLLLVSVCITLVFTAVVFFRMSTFLFLLLCVSSYISILIYLEILYRFCVVFGITGNYHFSNSDSLQKTNDPVLRARDRKKTFIIGLQSLVIACIYSGLIYLLTRSFHF
jgi:hypothetical protein